MNSLSCSSVALLWTLTAIPSFAQDVVVFDGTGVIVENSAGADFMSVELPTREWVTTTSEVEEKSWIFAEAEEPEIKLVAAPDVQLVIEEAEEATPLFAQAQSLLRETEAPAPRIEIAMKPSPVVRGETPQMEDLIDQGKVLRLYAIQFDYDKASLRPEAMPTIKEIAEALERAPELSIFVDGHTDARGSDTYNLGLSRRRAEAVVDALVNIHGIDRSRLTPRGVGEADLLDLSDSATAHQKNRRVEVRKRAG